MGRGGFTGDTEVSASSCPQASIMNPILLNRLSTVFELLVVARTVAKQIEESMLRGKFQFQAKGKIV